MDDNKYEAEQDYTDLPSSTGSEDELAMSFLELVYGILFEPVNTLKKVARRPPLVNALLLVTLLGLAGVLMWLLTITRVFGQVAGPSAMLPFPSPARPVLVLGAVLIFLWGYIKWFSYSAFISLAAEMLGGVGSARSVAAAAGISLIPTILLIPAQLLNYYLASTAFILITILGVWTWVTVLMVIGVREIHGLSSGRALLTVLSPVLLMAVFAGLLLAGLVAVAMTLYSGINLPGYF